MSSCRIRHSRWNDRVSRSPLRLEGLEGRRLLAGNVTAELVGSTLRLTGDALGNEVLVASATLGNGMNWMLVAGEADTPAIIDTLNYSGGANVDIVTLAGDVTVRNDVRIVTAGQVAATPHGTGAFFGNDDDAVHLSGTIRVRGSVSVITGGGDDAVSICSSVAWVVQDENEPVPVFGVAGSCSIGRELTVSTGAGADVVSIGNSTIGRSATIDTGSGDDRVDIEAMRARGSLLVRLRGGDDTLGIRNTTAYATFLYGGGGANSLATDAATRTGTRRMNSWQFRVSSPG